MLYSTLPAFFQKIFQILVLVIHLVLLLITMEIYILHYVSYHKLKQIKNILSNRIRKYVFKHRTTNKTIRS